ncbi:MAG TPA: SLBB domain-containing protein [Gemmatimonadales bacterium]|jgi:protein involved in polysaccharide export with SLBB domain|nr:SLBB domain-containing protein [Gemmatimonadales bacterium]
MSIPALRLGQRLRVAGVLACVLLSAAAALSAQVPTQLPSGELPSTDSARALLQNPAVVDQLRRSLGSSGLTPDQIRTRLRAAGYPENLLDEYIAGADTTRMVRPGPRTFDAVRALGVVSDEQLDSLRMRDSVRVLSDSLQQIVDSLTDLRTDSLRADSLADSLGRLRPNQLHLFGLETFRKASTRFQPNMAGPVDENYRFGPGDILVLILTGDVQQAYTLEVTREGFVVIPSVGQVYVANLTQGELRDQLYARLHRVYSGVRRDARATTQFQISLARLRNIQVFVAGDVVRPGSYQISGAGTVMSALYAAGGPTENGSFRQVEIRRGSKLVDSLDLYDYLLHGNNSSDVRLSNGDVVFVPVHSALVRLAGKVIRPAIYETKPGETLRELIGFAGGFDPSAYQSRVQIQRILQPADRAPGGRARVVIDIAADQFVNGQAPPVPIAPGDSVTVFSIADRLRGYVTVKGNVWVEGRVGFTPGMKLSDALRLAGGPRPDVYLDQILITRVREDSSMAQLRSAFADSTGKLRGDLVLEDQDEVRIFSRSTFRGVRYVSVVGAVRRSGRVPFREGMTMRDAILLADGLTEDAYLKEAEIARIADRRDPQTLAQTLRVPLDSTYLFGRTRAGEYLGPPGAPAPASGAPEVPLEPYDNVLIMRQAGFDQQRLVYLTGQVKFPGRYALRSRTERLGDLIDRAGGLTAEAYAAGVQFYRAHAPAGGGGDERLPVLDRPTNGNGALPHGYAERVGIDLARVLQDRKFQENIILVSGDSINVPEYNPIVQVQGAVNSPGPVAYTPGKSLDWYVSAAGGYAQNADSKRPYVTQPNGKREAVKRRSILADHVPKPGSGAAVFVPTKVAQDRPSNLPSLLGIAAQVLGALVTLVVVAKR